MESKMAEVMQYQTANPPTPTPKMNDAIAMISVNIKWCSYEELHLDLQLRKLLLYLFHYRNENIRGDRVLLTDTASWTGL